MHYAICGGQEKNILTIAFFSNYQNLWEKAKSRIHQKKLSALWKLSEELILIYLGYELHYDVTKGEKRPKDPSTRPMVYKWFFSIS